MNFSTNFNNRVNFIERRRNGESLESIAREQVRQTQNEINQIAAEIRQEVAQNTTETTSVSSRLLSQVEALDPTANLQNRLKESSDMLQQVKKQNTELLSTLKENSTKLHQQQEGEQQLQKQLRVLQQELKKRNQHLVSTVNQLGANLSHCVSENTQRNQS